MSPIITLIFIIVWIVVGLFSSISYWVSFRKEGLTRIDVLFIIGIFIAGLSILIFIPLLLAVNITVVKRLLDIELI